MKKTRYITFCAVMSALSVVLLLLGNLLSIFDITAVILTSLVILIAREELGYKSLAIYAVTALICILTMTVSPVTYEYLIISAYPVFKPLIDKQPSSVKWMVKVVYILFSALCLLLIVKILTPDSPVGWDIVLGVGFALIFFLYDVLLYKFMMYYRFKLRHQLRIDKFFNQK